MHGDVESLEHLVAKLIVDEVVLQTSAPSPGATFDDWIESGRVARLGGLFALERVFSASVREFH
jgi:hypothetical protein